MKEIIVTLIIGAFLTRIVLYISYGRILKIAYNVSNSNHELLKQIKLRYTNCNTLDIPILNISAFVKKHILFNCGFKRVIPIIDTIGYVCLMASIFIAYTYYGMTKFSQYGVLMCVCIMMFLLLNSSIKGEEKLDVATTLISDYIENVLSHRNVNKYDKANKRKNINQPEVQVNAAEINEKSEEKSEENNINIEEKDKKEFVEDNKRETSLEELISTATDNIHAEMIINEVLKEYLV